MFEEYVKITKYWFAQRFLFIKEFFRTIKKIENKNESFLIAGRAGTGKTIFINYLTQIANT